MKIVNCQINHLNSPLGFSLTDPVLTYHFSNNFKGKFQKEAKIIIATNSKLEKPVFDSGWQRDIQPTGYLLKIKLLPYIRYYWQVWARTDNNQEIKSDINWFETAKENENWSAKWLTCDSTVDRHPIFSKDFVLNKKVKQARLYICGLGLYVSFLNKQKIGAEFLTPGCNNYGSWLQYQTYDVTKDLQGKNHLAVLLGNGWYKGRFGLNAKEPKPNKRKPWKLIAELHITFTDGSRQVINTDESWQITRSKITASGIYDGEARDDTLPDCKKEHVELSKTKHARLTARLSVPIKIFKRMPVKRIIKTPKGETVLDLGQNFAGIFKMKVNLPKSKKIKLQFSEHMQDGNFYRANLRTAKQEYDYTSNGKPAVLEPCLTYYGYRYVKVTGLNQINKEDFMGLALSSSIPPIGKISTGNKDINQLISNARWGMLSNFMDTPTDCPQRDERQGWTGDAQVFSATANYFADAYAFYNKYLYDMRTEQVKDKGMIPSVIPDFMHDNTTSSVWGDAATIIPWTLYQYYQDPTILEKSFSLMKDWVDYIKRIDGNDHAWEHHYHWGDWLALDNPSHDPNQPFGGTDPGFIADVYYYNSANIVARSARILGHNKLAKQYDDLAEQIHKHILDEFFSPNGRPCITTQTGLILALKYNLTKNRPQTIKMLRDNFADNHDLLQTGFTGTPLLGDTLTSIGLSDLVYKLLFNTKYPSWLYAVKMGATTIWERWNSVMPNGHIETSMSSLNHYSYGSIVEWIWRYAAGLNQSQNCYGFQNLTLKPHINSKLKEIKASYNSASGDWQIGWKIIDNWHLHFSIIVPFNCQAQIKLPSLYQAKIDKNNPIFANSQDGICHLAAGRYEITYLTNIPLINKLSLDSPVQKLMANDQVKNLLLKKLPVIKQIPPTMYQSSLRAILSKFGGFLRLTNKDFDQIDQEIHHVLLKNELQK